MWTNFKFILNYSICMQGWGTVKFWMETNDDKYCCWKSKMRIWFWWVSSSKYWFFKVLGTDTTGFINEGICICACLVKDQSVHCILWKREIPNNFESYILSTNTWCNELWRILECNILKNKTLVVLKLIFYAFFTSGTCLNVSDTICKRSCVLLAIKT